MIVNNIDICEELSRNFLDFAYEANSCRAFVDVRDGLKPGMRACLWEMYKKGYTSNKPHVKAAKISGGVVATWWPHSTTAIYETFARMSQDWINNIPEVDWHGMNGSQIISGEPAADRYCESRLAKIVEEGMLKNIKKNSVPMIPNFSEDDEWPEVFPSIFPRLLVNGCQGIGSTIANVFLPVPFVEAAAVLKKYIETEEVDVSLIAPSFPSGGIIINKNDIHTIYETGKGKVILRARTHIEGNSIFITEMPYQVYVEPYIEKVKELIKKDELTGIEDILNRSDKNGIRIEIICESNPEHVLRMLYSKTELQTSYSANQWALVGKTPKLLTLKDYCKIYLDHNISCLVRENEYDLQKAQTRLHILNGLLIALSNIDDVIHIIRTSDDAESILMERFNLSEKQVKAILDMKLANLKKLERTKLEKEQCDLNYTIESIQELLSSTELQKETIKDRLMDLVKKFGDKRRTELIQIDNPTEEPIKIEPENCVVVLTEGQTIKRIPTSSFKKQKRAGMGVKNQEDIASIVIKTNTIDDLLVFTTLGKMYKILVDNIPKGTNTSKGTPISSLIQMEPSEQVSTIYSIYKDTNAKYVFFTTKKGQIKKTPLEEYTKTKRRCGLNAINLKEGDTPISVSLINEEDMIIVTRKGQMVRIKSTEVPISSRISLGVKGITLNEDDSIIKTLPYSNENDSLAIFSTDGYGKRMPLPAAQKRGGKGVMCYRASTNKEVAAIMFVSPEEDNLLIVGNQRSICIAASDIPLYASNSSTGIKMITGDNISAVSKV